MKFLLAAILPEIWSETTLMCDFGFRCEDILCTTEICEYNWLLEERHSMSWRYWPEDGSKPMDLPVDYNKTSGEFELAPNLFHDADPRSGIFVPKMTDSYEDFTPIDGRHGRRIITINGKFSGPVIRVTKGAKVIVRKAPFLTFFDRNHRVFNDLPYQSATVHWHGILQTNNFWMDGAAFISQCPILPHTTFVYSWTAENYGTHWYHSHMSNQRMDGVFGPIIIEKKKPEDLSIPLVISDWFQTHSADFLATNPYDRDAWGKGIAHCALPNKAFSKDIRVKMSSICVDSIIVNGYGSFIGQGEKMASLQETFHVKKSQSFVRLSLIHAGFEFPARFFRMDFGPFEVVETDGQAIEPFLTNQLILGIGETFIIKVPLDWTGKLALRSELLADCTGPECTEKIISPYKDVLVSILDVPSEENSVEIPKIRTFSRELDIERPSYNPEKTKPDSQIVILNCFWPSNNPSEKCVSLHKMKSASTQRPSYVPSNDEVPDKILNFTLNFNLGASINNKRFKYMNEPMSQGYSSHTKCSDDLSVQEKCAQIVTVQLGEIVEIRMTSAIAKNHWSFKDQTYHTVHMHGNEMYVLNIANPILTENGTLHQKPHEMHCKDEDCINPNWDEEMLSAGHSFDKPILKNVILLPPDGFSVIRFKAENPGWWPFHCHQAMHNAEGMSLILHVEDKVNNEPLASLPADFPTCGDFGFQSRSASSAFLPNLKFFHITVSLLLFLNK